MNIFCAKEISGNFMAEWGYIASCELEARRIADERGWDYIGALDDLDVTDQDRALIERDLVGCSIH